MLSGLFGRRPVEVSQPQGLTAWGDWSLGTMSTWAGVTLSPQTAMQMLAVYGSQTFIADQISTMPLDTFRKEGKASLPVTKPVWLEKPTPELDFVDWCGQVVLSLLSAGNSYIGVLRSSSGAVGELPVVDPARVRVEREGGRKVIYIDGVETSQEIVHIKGIMRPGAVVGISPIEAARQGIGLGLAALEHGAAFFTNEGNMPGVIEFPGNMQPDQMRETAELWRRRRTNGGKGLPGVLSGGGHFNPTGMTAEQSQFLQTRQWSAAEIAGQVFKLDPSDLGIPVTGTSLTYTNSQDRKRHRYEAALQPWLVRVETALSALLQRPRFVKFNMDAYLRGDTAQRFAVYESAERISTSLVARGDAPLMESADYRALEDMPPLPKPDAPPMAPAPAAA